MHHYTHNGVLLAERSKSTVPKAACGAVSMQNLIGVSTNVVQKTVGHLWRLRHFRFFFK